MFNLNPVEIEALILKSTVSIANNLVNKYNLSYSQNKNLTHVFHRSQDTFNLFVIHLTDFLSPPGEEFTKISSKGYLWYLKKIAINTTETLSPYVSNDLYGAVEDFEKWLKEKIVIEDAWLPDIDLKTNINISRYNLLKISGNHLKHNISRFSNNIKVLEKIFKDSNNSLSPEEIIISCSYLIDNFFLNVVNIQTSQLAGFINNIRWAIHNYLLPIYKDNVYHYKCSDSGVRKWGYAFPKNLDSDFGKGLYWDLMNDVSTKPYVPQFIVDPIFINY